MARGDEARVRVRLDTKQAKSELRDLTRGAAAAGQGVSGRVRSALGTGLRATGLGAAAAAGFGAVRGAAASGVGDTVEALLIPLKAMVDKIVGGPVVRADVRALKETQDAFGMVTGEGPMSDAARNFFDSVKAIRLQEESGRSTLQEELGIDIAERIAKRLGEELAKVSKELLTDWRTLIFGGLGSLFR